MSAPLVPQTYFLEDAANLARGSILSRLDPTLNYQPYFRLDLGGDVPQAHHASWDYCDMAGRFVDALILTAPMVGANGPSEAEEGLRAFLLDRFNPRDGLAYDAEAPWSRYHADMFCQGRATIGLVSWYLLTGSAAVEERIEGQIVGLTRYARATDSPAALKLARGLSLHFQQCGVVAPDGTFKGHTHNQGI